MINPTQVLVSGPLAEFGPGYASELLRQGYKTNPAGLQMNLMAHLSRWLADEGLDVHRLSDTEVERYLRVRRAAGWVNHCGCRAMRPIFAYLRGLGMAPTPSITMPEGSVEVVLERYRHYLTVDRGLTIANARGYLYAVRPFLGGRILPGGHALSLEHLHPVDITTFVVACCAHGSRGTAKRTVTALRSLLRFLHVEGMVKRSLAAVPSIARWHLAGLPKSLEPAQVRNLLASCDRRTRSGRRDFAILTLLVRLGLRAGEVAALALDDIDWRVGEMVVHGKGKRADRLPLPTDVGAAMAAYLRRGRLANAEDRSVFVRVNAPHRALSTSGVAHVVTTTARRAGLGHIHAHRLRHTTATQLLRDGNFAHVVPGRHLSDPDRPVGSHRDAGGRSDRDRPRRLRFH